MSRVGTVKVEGNNQGQGTLFKKLDWDQLKYTTHENIHTHIHSNEMATGFDSLRVIIRTPSSLGMQQKNQEKFNYVLGN